MPLYRLLPEEDDLVEYDSQAFKDYYMEEDLQSWVEKNPGVIFEGEPLLIIGREVASDTGHPMDLLGIDRNGYPVIIELKATRTPRDVVCQTLDYASWIGTLSDEEVISIADDYLADSKYDGFSDAFNDTFSEGKKDFLESLLNDGYFNSKRRLVIIAEEADIRTKRMVKETDANGFLVSLISYDYYKYKDDEYINFETIFSSISPRIDKEKSIQDLRQSVISQKKPIDVFDHLHGLLSEREDLVVDVGKNGTAYKIDIENKLYSLINLYPVRKDNILNVYLYLNRFEDFVDIDKFLQKISEIVGESKEELLTKKIEDASFKVRSKEKAEELFKLIEEALDRK